MKKSICFFFTLLVTGFVFLRAQVAPLTSTSWNQGCNYNTDCPADGAGACGHVYTGCGATAFAQMLKFYSFPPSGWGAHSYTAGSYGTQSATFSSSSYNWSSMPNALSSANTDVAQIMYHCGVALDMGYGASGSYCSFNSQSLKQYFKYSLSVRGALSSQYTSTAWENLVISELNAGRVVFASGGSHFYIIDGYQTVPTLKFHMNFGWGGLYNGYYDIHSVIVGSTNYTPYSIVVGIKPLSGLEVSPDTVSVSASAGSASYEVSSLNTSWTASSPDSWITPALLSGGPGFYTSSNGASAAVSANATYSPRYGSVVYNDGSTTKTVVIKQSGIQPFIFCLQNNLTYSSASSMQTVTFSCDSNWTITTSAPWLTVNPVSGAGNGSTDITVSANPSTSTRTGSVFITRGSLQDVVAITQAGSGSFWCTPAMNTPGTNGITNVTLNTLNRTSAINEGYINTNTGTTLKIDTSYTIYVTFSGSNAPAVWIDWNIDGDFSDAGEAVVSPSGTWYPSFSSTKNMTFTVPATAVEGVTRMRVYAKAFGTGPVTGPCNTTDNGGDIEDYNITVMNQKHITVNPTSLTYAYAGSTQNVSIDCDSSWQVSSPAAWLSFTAGSGTGNGSNGIIASANSSTIPRSASVTYTRGTRTATVSVSQDGADTILLSNTLSATFANSGGTQNMIITSNVAYTISSSQPWISTSTSAGSGNGSFLIVAANNPAPLIRTGTVTISSGSFSQVINISQDSTSTILNVAPSSLNYSSAGGTQSFTITTSSGWTASTGDTWIGIDQNAGTGNGTINVTAAMNGTTAIRTGSVTVTNGLVSQIVTVTQDSMITTGLLQYASGEVSVYPNPANDFIILKTGKHTEAAIVVLDPLGRVVMEQATAAGEKTVSTSAWATGIYLLLVKENGMVTAQHRLVIQH